MNSEGKASRDPSREALQESYTMSAEMRRGSVGAVYGLHHKKKSLLVDRHPRYLSRLSDTIVKRVDKIKSQETKKVRILFGGFLKFSFDSEGAIETQH